PGRGGVGHRLRAHGTGVVRRGTHGGAVEGSSPGRPFVDGALTSAWQAAAQGAEALEAGFLAGWDGWDLCVVEDLDLACAACAFLSCSSRSCCACCSTSAALEGSVVSVTPVRLLVWENAAPQRHVSANAKRYLLITRLLLKRVPSLAPDRGDPGERPW